MENASRLTAAPNAPLLGQALPVELMNTIWADRRGTYDSLAAPADARAWASALAPRLAPAVRSAAGGLAAAHAAMLQQLRDAVRHLAALATGDPRPASAPEAWPAGPAGALETVNRLAALAPSWPALALSPSGVLDEEVVTDRPAGDLLVALLAGECVHFLARAEQIGLRACLAPGCVLYFVKDHPRRAWCSGACGNRVRAARHYSRHGRATGARSR